MSKRKYQAEWDHDQLPFCRGVDEIGGLNIMEENEDYLTRVNRDKDDTWFDTMKEAWEDQFKCMRDNENRPIIFNFIRYKGHRKFANHELRDLVLKQKDAIFVYAWNNPYTGNRIEMYILTNGSKK